MDSVLFGALTVQLCKPSSLHLYFGHLTRRRTPVLYYQAFPNDVLSNKSLAYTIYILNFGMTMLFFRPRDCNFRIRFFQYFGPDTVAFLAQSFYAYRIHVLSKTRVIPCCNRDRSVLMDTSSPTEASQAHFLAVGVWCGGSALCDILIAVCMTYYLTKINTELRHIGAWLSKLTRLTIETNSLTAVVALVAVTLWLAFPHDIYYLSAGTILPKFYGYSVLVVLNSRIEIVGSRGTHPATTSQIIAAVSLPPFPRDTRATIDRENPSVSQSLGRIYYWWHDIPRSMTVFMVPMRSPRYSVRPIAAAGTWFRAVYDALIRLSTVEKRSKIPELRTRKRLRARPPVKDPNETTKGAAQYTAKGGLRNTREPKMPLEAFMGGRRPASHCTQYSRSPRGYRGEGKPSQRRLT
ncbi:hypothetical protein B0H14DRAFT_3696895 [Mycena olivaceomarginata]|nr:hypothetical protein B0H14DRAFT_3696895 [Mycena olivaceomarginata]